MLRNTLIYIALLFAGIFTINAYWLGLNGAKTVEINNRLPVLFAPPEYVYLIFFVIMALNFVFFIAYKSDHASSIITTNFQAALYICVAIVHVFVLYIWHQNQFMSAFILQCALVLLIFSLFLTYPLTKQQVFFRTPIAMLLGWHFYMLLLIISITTVHYEWSGFGISDSLWTVIYLTIGAIVAFYLKYKYNDFYCSIILTWCYIGVVFVNGFNDLLVSAAAIFLIIVMLASIILLNPNKKTI